jgi:NADH-quinone oxidoreductase subunit G
LPGGRPAGDAAARAELAALWGEIEAPDGAGRDADAILRAAAAGELALLVGSVDPVDFPDPALALEALDNAPFIVSLELRESAVTDRADVVFPVAPVVQKAGSFLDWEGRVRPFAATLEPESGTDTTALTDGRVLDWLAEGLGVALNTSTPRQVQAELQQLGAWTGVRAPAPTVSGHHPPLPQAGEALLSTWHLLLDDGRLQEDEPHLAGTRKPATLLLSETTAKEIGATAGSPVTVSTDRGAITLPLTIADLPERVVWLPTHSSGSHVHEALGVTTGAVVRLASGGTT